MTVYPAMTSSGVRDRGSSFFDTKTKHNRESTNRQSSPRASIPPSGLQPTSSLTRPTATFHPLNSCTPHPATILIQQRNTTIQRKTVDQHNANCYCYCSSFFYYRFCQT